MPITHKNTFILITAVALYLTSMFLPALYTEFVYNYTGDPLIEKNAPYYGWKILILGWAGIFDYAVAWYANPAFIATIILYINNQPTCITSAKIALALAVTSLLYRNIWSEDGTPEHIANYGPAFYLWLSSFILILLAATRKFR